jgi:protein arginine kinase activator
MICQDCHQNEASVPFIQIVDGQKTVHQLCAACAEKRGGTGEGLTVTLTAVVSGAGVESAGEEAPVPDLTCAFCGLTYAEFKKSGRFGCDGCYVAFGPELDEVFKRIHGTSRHAGHAPEDAAPSPAPDLDALRKALQEAVARENFEEAARLRDRIGELTSRPGAPTPP